MHARVRLFSSMWFYYMYVHATVSFYLFILCMWLLLGRNNLDSVIKQQRYHFVDKGPYSQNYGFFPVAGYGCESWTIKKAEWWRTDVFERWCWRRLERPLDNKEIQPVHPEGNQSWIFIGRTDAEAETPILWPPDAKNQRHWKRPRCWERSKVGGEGDDRRWDGWMASLTQGTWV